MDTQQQSAPPQGETQSSEQAPIIDKSDGKSVLGGAEGIRSRLEAFRSTGKLAPTSDEKKASSEAKPKDKPQQDKPSLPIEKAAAEKVVAKPASKTPIEKATEKPEDPNKGTDGMTPEQRKSFIEARKSADDNQKRVVELEKLVADKDATAKERDELRQRLEQREKEMESVEVVVALDKLKKSTEYQESIGKPMQKLINELHKISKSSEIPFDAMLDAIENENEVKGNAELSEMMERLDGITAKKLERMVQNIRDLNAEADTLHRNPNEALKAAELREKERKDSDAKKSKDVYDKSFDAVVEKFRELDPALLQENGELTPEAKEAFDQARAVDWDKTPPDMKAYFAQAGYLLIQKNDKIAKQAEEIERLQDSVAKLTKKPGASGGSTPSQSTEEASVIPGKKPGDRFAAWRAGQG